MGICKATHRSTVEKHHKFHTVRLLQLFTLSQCREDGVGGGGGAGKNYLGPAVRKGTRGSNKLHMILSFIHRIVTGVLISP